MATGRARAALIIERLDEKRHDRRKFDCGEESLNRFLHTAAGQDSRRDLSMTFVLTPEPNSCEIMGYYVLLASVVRAEIVPDKKLPPHREIPIALLGRLAVNNTYKGQGLGRLLLFDAMSRVQQATAQIGFYALVVDALHEQARAFYLKYGFQSLLDDPLHLYLSLKTIRAMNLEPPS